MPDSSQPTPWTVQGEDKRVAVRSMFAEIAGTYDRVNGLMSFNQHNAWRAAAIKRLDLKPGESVLDVCCGTGDFLIPAQKAVGESGRVTGIDFCEPMLRQAGPKLNGAARLSVADACALPFSSSQFDAVTIGWGLRNVPDMPLALQEMARVLKPGGRIAILDMARPRGPLGPIIEKVTQSGLPMLGRLIGKSSAYTYLPKSILTFASREEIAKRMEEAGFTNVRMKDFCFGNICLHWAERQ